MTEFEDGLSAETYRDMSVAPKDGTEIEIRTLRSRQSYRATWDGEHWTAVGPAPDGWPDGVCPSEEDGGVETNPPTMWREAPVEELPEPEEPEEPEE